MSFLRMVIVLLGAWWGVAARGLTPDEIVLVVNGNARESVELGRFYARARLIDDSRIIRLKLPAWEQIPPSQYDRDVAEPIRAFLREHGLEQKIRCIVTFHGVPLRIAGRVNSPAEQEELRAIERERIEALRLAEGIVADAETYAAERFARFAPLRGDTPEALALRADAALRAMGMAAAETDDAARREELAARAAATLEALRAPVTFERPPAPPASAPASAPGAASQRATPQADTRPSDEELAASVERLQELRFRPSAREALRLKARREMGLLGYARILHGQADFFDVNETVASVDSELSLLWWPAYSRAKYQFNPLHHRARHVQTPPVLMVARLDAPDASIVTGMILSSLKAERDGLKGRIVLDSRGIPATQPDGKVDGYGLYDESIRRLRDLLKRQRAMTVLFDGRPEVLPPNTTRDVALYCGWYSVANYQRFGTFAEGAVGFHVASFELTTLRGEGNQWVKGLLRDGVVATVGPVAEPYLTAFPAADEFFPLLMIGRLPLAEVYWRTCPFTSWQMCLIGDPLYRPFGKTPALTPEDLPATLREALAPR